MGIRMAEVQGWIGVDFDGTLALENFKEFPVPGLPVERMAQRVRVWHGAGREVRIVTARVGACTPDDIMAIGGKFAIMGVEDWIDFQRALIEEWCLTHLGFRLEVTCAKDFQMLELWDDRCVQVLPNTGISMAEHHAMYQPLL